MRFLIGCVREGFLTKRRALAEKFLRKLAGMVDLEDALKKLDRLTQEEARMALAEMLSVTHNIRDDVKIVDGKVERVENKVEDVGDKVGDKVEEVGDKVGDVGDKVQRVDDKVQVVIDGARTCPIGCQTILTSILADGKQTRVAAQETRLVVQHAANDIDEIKCSWLPNIAIICSSLLNLLAGNQFIQLLRSWLSPADPSTNHNIARGLSTTEPPRGSFKARSSSNGSLPPPYCGYTENVRFRHHR